jgi:hypothetical protein
MAKRGRKSKVEAAAASVDAKPEPKHRGRKSQYDAATKAAILKATAGARGVGRTWTEALQAAKDVGYKGSLPYLMQMAQSSGAVKVRTRRRRKAGRPAGGRRGPGRPASAASSNGIGLGAIDKIVENMVATRLSVAVKRAVIALERATAELRSL